LHGGFPKWHTYYDTLAEFNDVEQLQLFTIKTSGCAKNVIGSHRIPILISLGLKIASKIA